MLEVKTGLPHRPNVHKVLLSGSQKSVGADACLNPTIVYPVILNQTVDSMTNRGKIFENRLVFLNM